MELSYVLLNEENRGDFDTVFPEGIALVPFRVAFAAVDEEGRILGAVSYILLNYEYLLDWVYVEPEVRRQGVGTQLVEEVFRIIVKTENLFPLTARFEYSNDDTELHTFFLSIKYMYTSYSHERYYVTKEDLRSSEGLKRSVNSEVTTEKFFDLSVAEQKKILTLLMMQETYVVGDYEQWKKTCVPELCRCVYAKNTLVDLIIMQRNPDGNMELSYLYGKYPKGLFQLLSETVKDLEALFPESNITFDAMNDESVKLAEHLFPKARKAHVYEAEF